MFGYREEIAWLASHCRDTRKTLHQWGYIIGEYDITSCRLPGFTAHQTRDGQPLFVDAERFYRNSVGHGASLKGFFKLKITSNKAQGYCELNRQSQNSHLPLRAILRFVYTFALGINYRPGRQAVNCWVLSQHKVINLAGGLPAEPMISFHYGPSEVVLLSPFMWRKQTLC